MQLISISLPARHPPPTHNTEASLSVFIWISHCPRPFPPTRAASFALAKKKRRVADTGKTETGGNPRRIAEVTLGLGGQHHKGTPSLALLVLSHLRQSSTITPFPDGNIDQFGPRCSAWSLHLQAQNRGGHSTPSAAPPQTWQPLATASP